MSALPHDDLATAPAPRLRTEVPGPTAREYIARDRAVTSPSLARVHPLVPARAAGCVIEDVDGNRFLDFNAGIAVTATGHCHPRVVEAIERQARSLLHYCSSDWFVPAFDCPLSHLTEEEPSIPKLLRAYLGLGATICGPPALDRCFKTIDFLTLLDLKVLPLPARERFLS